MPRQLAIALVTVLAMLAPSLAHADGSFATFVGCPAGQAIRGINFVTRALVCVPVGGDTTALQARVTALESALAIAQATIACMHTVGTDVFFEGCNVHILSGSGSTSGFTAGANTVNGLGNLIVGYNENIGFSARTGSHNIVVGPFHAYSSYGGLVAGIDNTISGPFASVSGGQSNTASGDSASVSGGQSNTASGAFPSSVSGGRNNEASGFYSSVSGGASRSATGVEDWVAGSLFQDN